MGTPLPAVILLAFARYGKHTFPWLEHNERATLGLILTGLAGFGYFFHRRREGENDGARP